MADLNSLIAKMLADGTVAQVATNPLAQFGTAARRYVGAEILPERLTDENSYREANVRYRTVIANSGTRYSPAQKKGGVGLVGDVLVELGSSDIAREMTGREFDALLKLFRQAGDLEAMASLISWVDINIVRALVEVVEKERWQAIVDGSVVRRGANGYNETITYSNPAGHRAAAGGDWDDDTYDPFDDILAMHQLLSDKGYQTSRIITSSKVISKMAKNAKVSTRTGSLQVNGSGQIVTLAGFATRDAINGVMSSSGLPALETYDLTYRDEDGSQTRFFPDNAMVFVSQTGQDEIVQFNNADKVVPNVLGYAAIGRGVGQAAAGRVIVAQQFNDKPPRIEAQGWQESLPVITEPEAMAVITGIN